MLTDAALDRDSASLQRLDDVIRRNVLRGSLVRVKVWRSDGTIVYSDEPRRIGDRFDLDPRRTGLLRRRRPGRPRQQPLRAGEPVRDRVEAARGVPVVDHHGDHRVGDLSARVTNDVDSAQDVLVQVLATLLPNVLLVVGMFTAMLVLDPTFTLLALASTVPLAVATRRSRG